MVSLFPLTFNLGLFGAYPSYQICQVGRESLISVPGIVEHWEQKWVDLLARVYACGLERRYLTLKDGVLGDCDCDRTCIRYSIYVFAWNEFAVSRSIIT